MKTKLEANEISDIIAQLQQNTTMPLELSRDQCDYIIESLDAKERLDIQREINSRQIVEISKLKAENEELTERSEMNLNVTLVNWKNEQEKNSKLQQEINQLKQLKQKVENFLKKKYGEFVNNPAHTEEWKLLEQISEIMREA